MADRTGGVVVLLLVAACRGAPPSPGAEQARSDSALTARTWGLAYLQQQQLPRAEAEFQKVVALAPDQALGYADLGLVYLREGRLGEAEAQLRRAAALDSSNNEIVLMLAEVYRLSGREVDARHELDRVLHSDSTDIRALYALARLAAQAADPAGRPRWESLLRRVLARAPANIVARLELVDLLLARGSAGAAAGELEALQRQLPRLPPEAARFFQRALVLARTGRAAEAAIHATRFHRAMELTATYQVALERLGGAAGALAGYPVLTFNANMAVPTDDPRAVAAAIRFTDVTAGSGLEVVPALPESVASSLERAVALAVGTTTTTRPKTCSSRATCSAARWDASSKPAPGRGWRSKIGRTVPSPPRSVISTTMDGSTCTSPPPGEAFCSATRAGAGFATSPRPAWPIRDRSQRSCSQTWTTTATSICSSRRARATAPIAIISTARSARWPHRWAWPWWGAAMPPRPISTATAVPIWWSSPRTGARGCSITGGRGGSRT